MSAEAFVHLCRSLDIGRHYQDHVRSQLQAERAPGLLVEAIMEEALSANLELAATVARIKGEIDEQTYKRISHVVGPAP
ncbi:hypothetical protein EI534_39445, partial [Pseudomonas frederiksbergensis]|nr:hypothetical protein [Pseudomonas frederiksbergensis]